MPVIKRRSPGLLARVSATLSQLNRQAYLVGGFVRDWVLARKTADIDIAVGGDSLSAAQRVAAAVGGKYVLLDEANRVARVVVDVDGEQWQLDFSSFSGAIENDLARRDFTIDAMAFDLEGFVSGSPEFIDPFSGRQDIKMRLVRAVNEHVFEDDPARLLRAIRLAAELKFNIEPGTETLVRRNGRLAALVAGERLREELLRLLALPGFGGLVRYLDELTLLTAIIPELGRMKDVEQPGEHYWNVFDHSVETASAVEALVRETEWKYGGSDLLSVTPWSKDIEEHLDEEVSSGSRRRFLLKLAGLLHDIGKPSTKTFDETGRMRFLGHPRDGAAMAVTILRRLRFSGKETRLVENLVYHHLRPVQMSHEGLPSGRAIYRYFRDTEGAGMDVLYLALADYLATHGPRLDMAEWRQHNRLISYIMSEYARQKAETAPVKLVSGDDLMETFGLRPDRLIGELLSEVREAQASGEVSTREEAIALVRRILEERPCEIAC